MSDEAVDAFAEFKKSSNATTYLIFHIVNKAKIEVESQSEDKDFATFLSALPADDGRYGVYKRDFTTTDGRAGTKLVFIAW